MQTNELNNKLSDTIYTLSRLMKENIVLDQSAYSLTLLQFHALIFIAKQKHTHMREIAEYFHVEMPTATSLLNKLCNMQLVERLSDNKDRRLVNIALTSVGKTLLKKAKAQHQFKINKILEYLSFEEKEAFLGILQKMIDRMKVAYEK